MSARNVLFILIDSLNRHYLGCYGNPWIQTPNIDRLARMGMVFENHFLASAPCMPARRCLFTGRNEFFWRPWGSLEPFDRHLASEAAELGATTAMVTDHYHYWEQNGNGYLQAFAGIEMIRGNELDNWRTDAREPLPPWMEAIARWRGERSLRFFWNIQDVHREEDFFAPRVMRAGAEWLARNHTQKFLLIVESFSPHEPFYIPEPYRSLYLPHFHLEELPADYNCWPPYQEGRHGRHPAYWEQVTPQELAVIRSQYAGAVTMVDHWLGRIWEVMDREGLWENTVVVLTTDHGHELGEKGRFGKQFPHYDLNAHIPLLIYHPDFPGGGRRVQELTSTVDLYPTLLECLGDWAGEPEDGRSLLSLLRGEGGGRECVVYGTFGAGATITTPAFTYVQGYDNQHPLYAYTTEPLALRIWERFPFGEERPPLTSASVPRAALPVWRIPFPPRKEDWEPDYLFDRRRDPEQNVNLVEERPEVVRKMRELLKAEMEKLAVPPEQFKRLRLEGE